VRDGQGGVVIRTLLRVAPYAPHPTLPSQWDDRVLAFSSDVMSGNHISMVEFPPDPFALTLPQTVPTVANTADSLAAQPHRNVLEHVLQGAPDTEEKVTRFACQVGPAYAGIVVGRTFPPRTLWDELVGAITNDNREADCEHLLTWMRIAMTMQVDPTDANLSVVPANCLPPNSLQPLDVDENLQQHRWNILRSHLPALDPVHRGPADPLVALIGVMRQERCAERDENVARSNAELDPKLPSAVFPFSTDKWMRMADVHNERDLPPIYGLLANSTKAERRSVLEHALQQRAMEHDAATSIPPIASKEMLEMVLNARPFRGLAQTGICHHGRSRIILVTRSQYEPTCPSLCVVTFVSSRPVQRNGG
jgi:hypothetical protein